MTTDPVALDAVAQARLVRSGQLSARELVAATLDAIDRLDPALNAYRVVLANRALEEADRLDRLHLVETLPLRGVPIAIKDDTDVAGEVTAWGSNAYGAPATEDAVVVARLRSAGAVIIGKTNVPELALWPWTASAAWGTTRNPWNPATTPGGSSGGSAAAVAAGMASMALGSDGGGSVRYPAALTALDTAPERLRIGVALGPPPGSGVRLTDRAAAAVDHVTDLLTSLGHQLSRSFPEVGSCDLYGGRLCQPGPFPGTRSVNRRHPSPPGSIPTAHRERSNWPDDRMTKPRSCDSHTNSNRLLRGRHQATRLVPSPDSSLGSSAGRRSGPRVQRCT
jgi:Asp-tRNA(Asn)/Glu-tRNA(Gln) amidotransferase A subunit family amidase